MTTGIAEAHLTNNPLTESGLMEKLEDIRGLIGEIKNYDISNVVFINVESFLSFICDKLESYRLRELLNDVEPYIPLIVSGDNLALYIEASFAQDISAVKSLESAFIHNSMALFISSVYNAGDGGAWDDIKRICAQIRDYKSSGRYGTDEISRYAVLSR